MLSRLAESSFWLGRYLERTEGLSRLLVEYHQLLVQDQRAHIARGCALLTHGLGLEAEAHTTKELIQVVYGDESNPSTILGALYGARANARSIRDTLPSDFYESINRLHAASEAFDHTLPGSSLKSILDRLAVSNGIYEWLAPIEETTHFYKLGRNLERMDLVSRLLLIKMEDEWKDQGPATTLRAVGGLSTFLKARIPVNAERVRHFLIKDPTFPRSLFGSGKSAELAIKEIATFNGVNIESVIRPIGLLGSQIQFLGDDPEEEKAIISRTPQAVEMTSEAIKSHFFRPTGSIVWSN
jgi:uncharacterized alpha-E superfamily protein